MTKDMTTVNFAGKVSVIPGNNPRRLYEHQIDAMERLNKIDKGETFNSLLVLPTGGGKTLTATWWLLKNAVDKNKKILWIAHRHLLLEQASETFRKNAFSNLLINRESFNYRIVSGRHDKAIHIKSDDDVLIVSKDSIIRNLQLLNKWLKDEEEIYVVIDEAHHATAKSYRTIINHVQDHNKNVKLLGLTATPFRTVEEEVGLLKQIFNDDIVYKIDLKDLIKKEILSRPQFEECNTEFDVDKPLGLNGVRRIELLDNLPDNIANYIAENKNRNAIIVKQYKDNMDKYKKTLIFAVNRLHAFTLQGLFKKNNIDARVVVTGTKADFTGIDVSNDENERNIDDYRSGKVDVLINVNILTEGVDLPKTQTVFLTRPTVSSILMTQMIGRALRGENAGGTKEAFIVSFIDNWKDNIAWVNAESLIDTEYTEVNQEYKNKNRDVHLISIAKIEEFARIIDDTVDTTELEKIDFIKKIPLGMYSFSFIDEYEEETMERNHQVLVYDSTKEMYENMIKSLPKLFKSHNITEEVLSDELLETLCNKCEEIFDKDMLPSYDEKDIKYILKYYAQKECEPTFIPFDEIDRKRLDISIIANEIVEKDMRRSEQRDYINKLWDEEDSIIKIYFNKKLFFTRQLQIEIDKIEDGIETTEIKVIENVEPEQRDIRKLTLQEITKINKRQGTAIKDTIYNKYINEDGDFYCNHCKMVSKYKAKFQIDHIVAMDKGGLTEVDNLQLLCSKCNLIKGSK